MKQSFLQRFVFPLVPKVGPGLFSKGGQGKGENSCGIQEPLSLQEQMQQDSVFGSHLQT